jgi:hypothetical protein
MLIKGYINQLCGETPTDLCMGATAHATNFAGLSVTLIETHLKATINYKFQSGHEPRELEDCLDAQPQRFAMLGITVYSYDAVVWTSAQVSGPMNKWWLNRKTISSNSRFFYSFIEDLRKTSLLPYIHNNTINAMLGITQGKLSYADYTQLSNDILRRSRQPLTRDLQCVRFINGLANFQLHTQAKSHRSQ